MTIHSNAHGIDKPSMMLLSDTSVVNTLYEFFKGDVLLKFYQKIQNTDELKDDNVSSARYLNLVLSECLAHLHIKEGQYDKAELALQTFDFDDIVNSLPMEQAIRFFLDKSRLFTFRYNLIESARTLSSIFTLLNQNMMHKSAVWSCVSENAYLKFHSYFIHFLTIST